MEKSRFRSEIFALADAYVEKRLAASPMRATSCGIDTYDDRLDDFSPAHFASEEALVSETLVELASAQPSDAIDRVAKDLMTERLTSSLAVVSSGETRRTFSVLWSPASHIRRVFEVQPAKTPEQAEAVRSRLEAVGGALSSWRQTLEEDSARSFVSSRRQALGVAAQLATYEKGAFRGVARRVADSCGVDAEESGLALAAATADASCGELAQWMRSEYAPRTKPADAVGLDRYRLWGQLYNGSELDFDELYQWGWEDLKETNARMWEIAGDLAPQARSLAQVAAALDADDERAVVGTEALVERLRSLTEGAVEMLDGAQFDIDERIRFCDARIAPEGSAGAPYYTGPSEDLSRPGITWYPTLGHDRFPMWRVVSTWYHESVPGHHLQVATSILNAERQSRFQRLEGFVSAYGEGWALYAERLMQELGAFSDRGNELGYLSKQAMRAARVVVDIGLHLSLPAPHDIGELGELGDAAGRVWDAEMAVGLLVERALVARDRAESEVDRYLGAPAQAISYKVGERSFLRCREEERRRLGESFELKNWHAKALELGPMGLSPFEKEMAAQA